MTSTITCDKCGAVLNVSPYLNSDLQLICDDLAAKLAAAEAERDEARFAARTMLTLIQDGMSSWKAADFQMRWDWLVKEVCGE